MAPVLIVGGGPVGLAAALFLTRRGVPVRIVDAEAAPHATSRALAVSPRTLDLLRDSGVAGAVVAEGNPIRGLSLHWRGAPLAEITPDWNRMGAAYPMTILPQARTEAHMIAALAGLGVAVERGRVLTGLEQAADGVRAAFEDGEVLSAPLLYGADGAHSAVRHALGVAFPGDGSPEIWRLMDAVVEGPPPDAGWIDLGPGRALVCLPYAGDVFRLFAFGRPLPDSLPDGWRLGAVRWRSDFKVSHRLADRFSVGRVALGGDAAHIHSPIGGRGMNLGIEDVWVFSACAADFLNGEKDRIAAYGRLRRPADARVVRTIRALTRVVTGDGPVVDLAKRTAPPVLARFPWLVERALRAGMGLDHPIRLR